MNELDKIKDYFIKTSNYENASRVRDIENNKDLTYIEKVELAKNIVLENPKDVQDPKISLIGKSFIVPEDKRVTIEHHRKKAQILREESRKLIEEASSNDKTAWDLIKDAINPDKTEDLGEGLNYNGDTFTVVIIKDKD